MSCVASLSWETFLFPSSSLSGVAPVCALALPREKQACFPLMWQSGPMADLFQKVSPAPDSLPADQMDQLPLFLQSSLKELQFFTQRCWQALSSFSTGELNSRLHTCLGSHRQSLCHGATSSAPFYFYFYFFFLRQVLSMSLNCLDWTQTCHPCPSA